jgi:hypothetical protein
VVTVIYQRAFFLVSYGVIFLNYMVKLGWLSLVLLCALYGAQANAISSIVITADKIEDGDTVFDKPQANIDLKSKTIQLQANQVKASALEARHPQLLLNYAHANNQQQAKATLSAEFKQPKDNVWYTTQLTCDVPNAMTDALWHCPLGKVTANKLNLPFSLDLTPNKHGATILLSLKEASFSDESGLHAAEKLTGTLQLSVHKQNDVISWTHAMNWTSGELFWDPFYITGSGHQFRGSGTLLNNVVHFNQTKLALNAIGQLNFSGDMQLKDYQFENLSADFLQLDLATAYPVLFKPFLDKTAFNHAELGGQASLSVQVRNKALSAFHLTLHDVDIDDNNHKFAFYKVNADIPWSYDEPKNVQFSYENGQLLNVPLGKTQLNAQVNRYAVTSPLLTLPVLDGALQLKDVSAARIGNDWYWHLAADLNPISMTQLSTALKWPSMLGKVSAQIPQVTYSGGNLTVNGEMLFNVFDGTVNISHLALNNPLSNNPILKADMALRHLDLGELTRTFSFGAIEGRLDGDINQLEMHNWKTVKLDAKVMSSPGDYPKKISQRAVENISALGGAGAAAAVQRSFLRFFEDFNYAKLGLSCQLRNDICQMDGIESTASGYVIVKGSGIPAITVMGFNQTVGWSELLARVKRITDGNTKAIVK